MFLKRKKENLESLIKDFLLIDQNEDLLKYYSKISNRIKINIEEINILNKKINTIKIYDNNYDGYIYEHKDIIIYLDNSFIYDFYINGKKVNTIVDNKNSRKNIKLIIELKEVIFKNSMYYIKTLEKRKEKIKEFKQKG